MSYEPPIKITSQIIDLISQISEAVGGIPSFFSGICRKIAHLLGWEYKLEHPVNRSGFG